MIPSAGFVAAVALQTKLPLSSKLSRNLGKYAKDVCTCFVDLGKIYDRVPREELWGVLREYGFDRCLLLAVS